MSARWLCFVLASCVTSCGGKVSEEPVDAAAADRGSIDAAPVSSTSPVDAAVETPASGVDCSGLKASGDPRGCGGDTVTCARPEPYPGYAEELLSCLVDKCLAEKGQPPWCGTITLSLDGAGCTSGYFESPSAGGCVKYQGFYGAWPCRAGEMVTVSRPCPG